jgi:hypothetical protein
LLPPPPKPWRVNAAPKRGGQAGELPTAEPPQAPCASGSRQARPAHPASAPPPPFLRAACGFPDLRRRPPRPPCNSLSSPLKLLIFLAAVAGESRAASTTLNRVDPTAAHPEHWRDGGGSFNLDFSFSLLPRAAMEDPMAGAACGAGGSGPCPSPAPRARGRGDMELLLRRWIPRRWTVSSRRATKGEGVAGSGGPRMSVAPSSPSLPPLQRRGL